MLSGDIKPSRYRKGKGLIQSEKTPESSNEIRTKQHRRHNSGNGSDLANVRTEQSHQTSDVSVEKSDSFSEKTKKDEQHNRSLVRTKSIPKGARRSASRNSLKSVDALEELTGKQTGSKSKQPTKRDEGQGNTSSGRNSRKASYAEDDASEQNEAESGVRQLLDFS